MSCIMSLGKSLTLSIRLEVGREMMKKLTSRYHDQGRGRELNLQVGSVWWSRGKKRQRVGEGRVIS